MANERKILLKRSYPLHALNYDRRCFFVYKNATAHIKVSAFCIVHTMEIVFFSFRTGCSLCNYITFFRTCYC